VAFIIISSLIIGVTDSIVSELIDRHHWTLGLSGVVMGMMGLFAYLLPGWILAVWYIGGDMFQLFSSDDHGAINVLAHVAGGISGFFYGFFFLKGSRLLAESLQEDLDKSV